MYNLQDSLGWKKPGGSCSRRLYYIFSQLYYLTNEWGPSKKYAHHLASSPVCLSRY